MSTRVTKAKLAATITCSPIETDSLPHSYQPSFAIEMSQFGPAEIRKALADSEMMVVGI